MSISKDHLVDVLRLRYDAYSAEAVFQMACTRAGLEGKTAFERQELAVFRDAVERVGDRVTGVLARIDALLASADKPSNADKASNAEKPTKADKPSKADKSSKADKPDAIETTIETTIALRGIELADGEQLLVCGACPALGDWAPERARPMTRQGDEWLTSATLAAGTEVAFKFLRRRGDGEIAWEAGGNRVVRGGERVDATWRADA